MQLKLIITLFLCGLVFTNSLYSQDWPKWRGLNGNSIVQETNWNPQALKNPKILWEQNVGDGFSTVTVVGDYLYTMGNVKKKDVIFCLDRKTGKEIWTYGYNISAGSYPGPRATPTFDNGLIYTLSREGHVFCLYANSGKLKWENNLQEKFDPELPKWGFASSPVISGEKLFINVGEYGIALNKSTGEILWKSDMSESSGYASFVPFKKDGIEYAAVFGGRAIYFIDIATGSKKWSYKWITSYDVNAADPIISDGRMFISSGYGTGCASFDIESSTPKLLWKNEKMRNHFGTCVLFNGYLYGIDGQAFGGASVKCLDFKTGEEKWKKDISFGSLILINDKLIVLTDKGTVMIAEATPKGYKEISSAKVLNLIKRDHVCWNIPVFSHGLLYCRSSAGQLVCVDLNK